MWRVPQWCAVGAPGLRRALVITTDPGWTPCGLYHVQGALRYPLATYSTRAWVGGGPWRCDRWQAPGAVTDLRAAPGATTKEGHMNSAAVPVVRPGELARVRLRDAAVDAVWRGWPVVPGRYGGAGVPGATLTTAWTNWEAVAITDPQRAYQVWDAAPMPALLVCGRGVDALEVPWAVCELLPGTGGGRAPGAGGRGQATPAVVVVRGHRVGPAGRGAGRGRGAPGGCWVLGGAAADPRRVRAGALDGGAPAGLHSRCCPVPTRYSRSWWTRATGGAVDGDAH